MTRRDRIDHWGMGIEAARALPGRKPVGSRRMKKPATPGVAGSYLRGQGAAQSCVSKFSAPEISALPGPSSMLSEVTTPSSTIIE
ncbi:hypothetical protein SAMN05216304_103226 [Bosea sp. OK403]|nr:hypothetical protein SAMN05216304_103226 [Bosea sp. OK403]